jgi:glycosyltransferase involved in cell wall biosynthesis
MKALISANLASNLYNRKNLINAILGTGWNVAAMACADHGEIKLEKDLKIPFYPLNMENKGTGIFSDLRTFCSFYRIYQKAKPDVVLHFNSKPVIYGTLAANLLGIPSINNITGLGAVFEKDGGMVQKIVCLLYKFSFSGKHTFVFFQNKDDRELFLKRKLINISKTGLLPGSGVDISYFTPVTPIGAVNADVPSKPTSFLFVGRLIFSKGIREFIRAAGIVQETFPETKFTVIGEILNLSAFIPENELKKAEDAGYIQYHGNTQDVLPFIKQADCVVLPSYYREGVPRALLEAASMGKPLIASDSIGTREPVREGKNGYLCKAGDAVDLSEKMLQFICLSNDAKNAMGSESRSIAVAEYSDTIIIRKYLEILPKGKE